MLKVLSFAIGLIGVFWMAIFGGAVVYWFDRRPITQFATLHWKPLPFLPALTFSLPPSLKTQLGQETMRYQTQVASSARTRQVVQGQIDTLTEKVSAAEDAAQAAIRSHQAILIKEIPGVLTPAVDRDFPIPFGLLRVHDSAASGVDLSRFSPVGKPDDGPSPVTASRFGAIISSNYSECRLDDERLTRLQGEIVSFNALIDKMNAETNPGAAAEQ